MKKTLIALTVGALAFGAYAEFKKNPDANTLWVEEGGNTAYGKNAGKEWRTNNGEIVPVKDAKNMVFGGAKDLGRYVPVSPDYPYFIVKVKSNDLKPKSYNAFSASLPGIPMFNVVTKVPAGTYVVKHSMNLKRDQFLRLDYFGKRITIEKMGMVKVPEVAVDMAPAALQKGDELTVTVTLQKEADAVDIKFHKAYTMPKIKLNGKDAYEMTGDASGKVWTFKVKYDNFTGFKPGEKLKKTNIIFAIEVIRGDKTEYVYAPSTFVTK